jgi:hypothetical protein
LTLTILLNVSAHLDIESFSKEGVVDIDAINRRIRFTARYDKDDRHSMRSSSRKYVATDIEIPTPVPIAT